MPPLRRLLLGLIAVAALACSAPERPPNLLLILADDLGWNDVGWHGGPIRTPRLDALAEGGVRFERFYSQPLCSATRASLLTGRYPMRQGLQMGVIRPWASYGLPLGERTLAEELRERGYRTAILGKWHLGFANDALLPTRRGFDHHYGHYTGAIGYETHRFLGGLDWHRDERSVLEVGYTTSLIADGAIRWLAEGDRERPFFLFVSFNAPHTPLQAPAGSEEEYAHIADERRRTYAAMVTALDAATGRILDFIEEDGLLDDTLVVFASDNGGEPSAGADNSPLRGGKSRSYEGGVRVPAFIYWRGRLPAGGAITVPVQVADLFPTLVTLAGRPPDPMLELDGRDLWPLLTGEADHLHETLLLELTRGRAALREGAGPYKLVVKRLDGEAERLELYDLDADPYETRDLARERGEVAARLRARLRAYQEQAADARWTSDERPPGGFRIPGVWSPRGLRAANPP
ncbi:MAG: arylsulfatase [Myxococcales bacterium]|nr:arylsulfatase [Myxococcales bacterium]